MVGVTASALIGVMKPLLGKLSTLLEREYTKLRGVRCQITFLQDELSSSMSTALEMVSESEEANPQVVEWMSQLRELSYDIEDCIEIFTHHLICDDTSDGFIHRIMSKITAMKARHRLDNQIDKLKGCVVEVNERRKRYELNLPASCSKSVVNDPRLPALYEEADRLVGIDREMDTLVKWLTDDIDMHLPRKVVSIVGFGGSGKTTLANQVFQKIKSQFNCTAFVSVSRSPNANKILVDTLLKFHKSSGQFAADINRDISRMQEDLYFRTLDYTQLVNMIREYLQNKRYFVIIDDIWSKQAWREIQCAFPNSNASRIMTTTRIQDVANCCCFPYKNHVYPMKPLDSGDSRRLFLERIFDHQDVCPVELQEVTDDILRKCEGLPLAIVNIASLLATKPTSKQEWERVRNSLSSSLEQDHELEVVKRILLLSYYDLPYYLKICLLDISIFPEDYEIDWLRLIWRWMAEGFIVEQRGQCLEDTGEITLVSSSTET